MKRILFLIAIAFTLLSCEKEKIIEVEVEPQYNWKQLSGFQYDNAVQLNSFASEEMIFFIGFDGFTSMVADTLTHPLAWSGNTNSSTLYTSNSSDYQLPIGPEYFISCSKEFGSLTFTSTYNPVFELGYDYLQMKDIAAGFRRFEFPSFQSGECIAINSQNQSLVAYIDTLNSFKMKLALIDVAVEDFHDTWKRVLITNTKILDLPLEHLNLRQIKAIGKYFYITADNLLYRIDDLGNLEKVLNYGITKFVEYSGKIYGFGYDNLFISSDNGQTWNQSFEIGSNIGIKYTTIDNRIIAYYRYGQVFEIIITDTEITAIELDNDGLDGVYITSVSQFDGKVFLTSFSGVYYKSIEDFFEPKVEE